MATYLYSIFRYVPDPVRGEQLNIGVAVAGRDPQFFGARFLPKTQFGRLKRLGYEEDFSFIQDIAAELAADARTPDQLIDSEVPVAWSAETLERASLEWANTIQLSAPRASIHERPEALIAALFDRYVADPRPRRQRARDRRWVRRRISQGFRQNLLTVHPGLDFDRHVRRDERVRGDLEHHEFDFVLANGQPLQFARTLSFEAGNEKALKTEIDATAWVIDDVRRANNRLPISVLSIGGGRLVRGAERLYGGLDARLIREAEIESWIDAASTSLLETIGAPPSPHTDSAH